MRTEILRFLRCLFCGASEWEKRVSVQTDLEMLEGDLVCKKCGNRCRVHHGVVDTVANRPFAPDIDETEGWIALAEKEGWNKADADYLRTIPFAVAKRLMPHDTLTWDRHCRNFFRTLSYLDLSAKRVLDLGAGRCWSTKYLALQGAECVATDIMSAPHIGLETAAYYLEENPIYFERVRCDMNELPFNDASFDIVWGQGAVHHSLDMAKTCKETARVLAPGGLLVLTNEHCNNFKNKESVATPDTPEIHEHCYRTYRMHRWLRRAGFGDFKIIPDVYYFKKDDFCYRRLSELGRFHSLFIALKLYIYGGVFNLIARKMPA